MKERLGDVMGGKVLKLLSEELLEQGMERGAAQTMVAIVCKRLRMGDSPEMIAEFVQESPHYIEKICDIAKKYAPDYDVEKIVEELIQ